jgi:hypothetical protein
MQTEPMVGHSKLRIEKLSALGKVSATSKATTRLILIPDREHLRMISEEGSASVHLQKQRAVAAVAAVAEALSKRRTEMMFKEASGGRKAISMSPPMGRREWTTASKYAVVAAVSGVLKWTRGDMINPKQTNRF